MLTLQRKTQIGKHYMNRIGGINLIVFFLNVVQRSETHPHYAIVILCNELCENGLLILCGQCSLESACASPQSDLSATLFPDKSMKPYFTEKGTMYVLDKTLLSAYVRMSLFARRGTLTRHQSSVWYPWMDRVLYIHVTLELQICIWFVPSRRLGLL